MNYPEYILLTAFGQLNGRVFGARVEDTYTSKAMYQGKQITITYKDTKKTKIINNKPRRIFELVKINEYRQTTE